MLEPSHPAKKVQSITQWLSALIIFVAIYAEKQATDTPKLIKYCEIVRDIAAKPGDWLYYDKQFRFIRQSAPLSISMGRYPLGTLALVGISQAGRMWNGCQFDHICFKCGS